MKQGNDFELLIGIEDAEGNSIDTNIIENAILTLGTLEKRYPGDIEISENNFKVRFSQEDTFKLKDNVQVEMRVKFINGNVSGSIIETQYVYDSINKEVL